MKFTTRMRLNTALAIIGVAAFHVALAAAIYGIWAGGMHASTKILATALVIYGATCVDLP